jgi:hypothetical protein
MGMVKYEGTFRMMTMRIVICITFEEIRKINKILTMFIAKLGEFGATERLNSRAHPLGSKTALSRTH